MAIVIRTKAWLVLAGMMDLPGIRLIKAGTYIVMALQISLHTAEQPVQEVVEARVVRNTVGIGIV